MLIVGVGAVGAEVARLLAPFGSRVVATDARRVEPPPFVAELRPAGELDVLLPRADAVIVTVPHTPATERLFGQRFEFMKPGSLFVNVGRGPVVDIDDLVSAIRRGPSPAAALDVVPDEPLDKGHPLWDMEEVIITPHVASATASANSERSRSAEYGVLVENARRFSKGEPLLNVVDKANWF